MYAACLFWQDTQYLLGVHNASPAGMRAVSQGRICLLQLLPAEATSP
jgi:hypothetical protein